MKAARPTFAAWILPSKAANPFAALAVSQVNAMSAVAALRERGLAAAHAEVQELDLSERQQLVAQCVALMFLGCTGLHQDLAAFYLR